MMVSRTEGESPCHDDAFQGKPAHAHTLTDERAHRS